MLSAPRILETARIDVAPAASQKIESRLQRELSKADTISISYPKPPSGSDAQAISETFARQAGALFGKRIVQKASASNAFTFTSRKSALFALTLIDAKSGDVQLRIRPSEVKVPRLDAQDVLPLIHAHLKAGSVHGGTLKFGSSAETMSLVINGNKFESPKAEESKPKRAGGSPKVKNRAPKDEDSVLVENCMSDSDDGELIEKSEIFDVAAVARSGRDIPVLVRKPSITASVHVRKPIAAPAIDDFYEIQPSDVSDHA